jgi:Pyruvate/2-oxoacid:ferredoxin oxidoreductase delta subunit
MARRLLGHNVNRRGRTNGDESIEIPVAKDLEKDPATMRREAEITFYNREYPLESFAIAESASAEWAGTVRDEFSPETTKLYEKFQKEMEPAIDWVRHSGDLEPTGEPTGEDVTDSLRQMAYELGYGEVGFTRFDRRYLYQVRRKDARADLPHAICLALEQDYVGTQTLPSLEAEEAQGEAYKRQAELAEKLVAHINSLGYSAQVSGPTWHFGPMIPMFVESGLGQLGVNGQLLSPHFGSRARLQIILTNAKVRYDKPVDYGIHKFCEVCQVCFMRCPGRAIQGQRLWFRGVEKAKLIYKRCRPVMARYSGCGVCMKVCPIQKYGLKPTMEHYIETGEILGKGTSNLEAYELPDKGYFRPGKLPVFGAEFFQMPVGRTEDHIVEEYKEGLAEASTKEKREEVWQKYRESMERALEKGTTIVDMGMDLAN